MSEFRKSFYAAGTGYYSGTGRDDRGRFSYGRLPSIRRTKVSYKCDYQRRCARFKDSLGLQDDFFFPEKDMCFCPSCHEERGDDEIYQRGNPPKPYVLPLGWSRFALKIPLPQVKLPRGGTVAAFDSWHMCFHGTLRNNVKPILETGGLRRPGDKISGGTLKQRNGHYNEENKPEGFDTLQVFVSPSIRYSSKDAYASQYTWLDRATGQKYKVRSAFQARIRPGSYNTGPTTLCRVRHGDRIDPIYSNNEIEWSTKQVEAIMLYGLLIKMEPCY